MTFIKIIIKGEKNSWWNPYIHNFFMARQNKEGKYEIEYLSNNFGDFCSYSQRHSEIEKKYIQIL